MTPNPVPSIPSREAAFDEWYAGQSHQLTNEKVCRVIWDRAWNTARLDLLAEVERLTTLVADLIVARDQLKSEVQTVTDQLVRIERIANLGSVDSFLQQSDEDKRKWFALAIVMRDRDITNLRAEVERLTKRLSSQRKAMTAIMAQAVHPDQENCTAPNPAQPTR